MGIRAERRGTTEAAIVTSGLRLLAEGGSEALTIRRLARDLHLVPSALYRYVKNRDELLALLLSHAHSDLIATIERAHDAVPRDDLPGRWRAFAHALRAWSLLHRHEWLLIQRTALAGSERAPATAETYRLHVLLLRLGADAEAAGRVSTVTAGGSAVAIPGLPMMLELAGVQVSEPTVLAGLAAWHLLDGALYAELLNLAGRDAIDADVYFDAMVAATERLVLTPEG